MPITIGINGFGRIGRQVCRIVFEKEHPKCVVSAINSTKSPEYLAYMFQYDTVHGKWSGTVTHTEDSLIINSNRIRVFQYRDPKQIPWKSVGVECVCESTGFFTTSEKAKAHIEREKDYPEGAKYVVISAPSKDDTPMFVMGVNQEKYSGEKIVSCASCTTNCLAPLVKIINNKYGVQEALMTTVHSTTSTQLVVDGSSRGGKDWRGGRAASNNIIPSSTGAAAAVGKVLPELAGKITGMAVRVPTINVSMVDLTCRLKKQTTKSDLIQYFREISSDPNYKSIIGYTEEMLVSSDFIGETRSAVLDVNACVSINDGFWKFIAWYDNEVGYSNRLVDLIIHMKNKN
jgi:glyceraldehyde 3-phosphate dehydrogenase